MYPIEVKEPNFKISVIEIFKDIINSILLALKSLRSPKTIIIFLQKKFHF